MGGQGVTACLPTWDALWTSRDHGSRRRREVGWSAGVCTLQEHLPRGIQATIWDEMAQGGRGGEAQMSAVQAWAWPQLGHGEREGVAVREGQRGSGEQGLAG